MDTALPSLYNIVDKHAVVNKCFSFDMSVQQWVPFALLSSYKLFLTDDNHINVLFRSSRKVPDISSNSDQIRSGSILMKVANYQVQWQPLWYGQTDRRTVITLVNKILSHERFIVFLT
jgi:hypothetical protein